jgi:S1-C subfamily serine protease
LVNSNGAVIGVNAAASFTEEGLSTGGWAVPIHRAMVVFEDVVDGVEKGGVHVGPPGFLGVQIDPAPVSGGALVSGVVADSAAAAAGLGAGDLIRRAGSKRISSAHDLSSVIASLHPRDRLKLAWRTQAGTSRTATVVLGSGPLA